MLWKKEDRISFFQVFFSGYDWLHADTGEEMATRKK
jgi:hypothetical protein